MFGVPYAADRPENHLLWMAMEPDRMAAVLHRVGEFYLHCARRPSPPPPLGSTGSSSGATWPTRRHVFAPRLLASPL